MNTLQLSAECDSERNSLNLLCEKWQNFLEKSTKRSCSEDTRGTILSVIGQSRLLLDKKMKQFEMLLADFGRGEGNTPPITLQDLQGFWELVMIQVRELKTKFANLELTKVPSHEVLQRQSSSSSSHKKKHSYSRYGDHH